MSFADVVTVLGAPPLCGIYWGSAVLLRRMGLGQPIALALYRAELAAAFVTAITVPVVAVVLMILVCIYA
jgi:hypothetical protein